MNRKSSIKFLVLKQIWPESISISRPYLNLFWGEKGLRSRFLLKTWFFLMWFFQAHIFTGFLTGLLLLLIIATVVILIRSHNNNSNNNNNNNNTITITLTITISTALTITSKTYCHPHNFHRIWHQVIFQPTFRCKTAFKQRSQGIFFFYLNKVFVCNFYSFFCT